MKPNVNNKRKLLVWRRTLKVLVPRQNCWPTPHGRLCSACCGMLPAAEWMERALLTSQLIIIIIMYIYHALSNALSAHIIHINLNIIFCTHVEHSPTKTIYIKYYTKQNKNKNTLQTHTHIHTHIRTHTHSDCSRNWVLILVRMEIL